MPRITTWIRKSNWEKFQKIANKSDVINDAIENLEVRGNVAGTAKSLDLYDKHKELENSGDIQRLREELETRKKVNEQYSTVDEVDPILVDPIMKEEPRYEPLDELAAVRDVFPDAKVLKTTKPKSKLK